jgi:cell division protein FtsB
VGDIRGQAAEGSVRKKRYMALLLAFALVMLCLAVFGENGLLHAFKLRRNLDKLLDMNEVIREENALLMEEIGYLRSHRGYIEQQAHRQGLVRENEIVFHFNEQDQ